MNRHAQGSWGGTGELEQLIERGRQLHSQALFAFCARLLAPLRGRQRAGAGAGEECLADPYETRNHPV